MCYSLHKAFIMPSSSIGGAIASGAFFIKKNMESHLLFE